MSSIIYMNNLKGFILMMVLSSLIILLWTSFYIAEIDIDHQTYGERTSILGRSFGQVISYDGIEKIVIDRVAFVDGSRGAAVQFDAHLKFTNGEKFFLVSDDDEKELIKRLQPILKKLRTEII